MNANGNPGEWALAGAKVVEREVQSLSPLPPKSPSVNIG